MYYLPHIWPSLKKTSHSLKHVTCFPGRKSCEAIFPHYSGTYNITPLATSYFIKTIGVQSGFPSARLGISALAKNGCLAGDICDTVVFFFIRVCSTSCLFPPKYPYKSGAAELGYIYCQEFKLSAVLTKTHLWEANISNILQCYFPYLCLHLLLLYNINFTLQKHSYIFKLSTGFTNINDNL